MLLVALAVWPSPRPRSQTIADVVEMSLVGPHPGPLPQAGVGVGELRLGALAGEGGKAWVGGWVVDIAGVGYKVGDDHSFRPRSCSCVGGAGDAICAGCRCFVPGWMSIGHECSGDGG